MEGWVEIMYNIADASSYVGAALLLTPIVVIGSFLLLNLTLAIIVNEFQRKKEKR